MADRTTLKPAPNHDELPSSALRWYADTTKFDFPSTAFVEPLEGIIGQRRALDAIRLGADIFSPGYNIFVNGLSGTGRMSTIKNILQQMHPDCNVPHDYAYVHNFCNEDTPRLLTFPAGKAVAFREDMKDGVQYLTERIPKMFSDEKFRARRQKLVEKFQDREAEMLEEFGEKIKPEGFVLGQRKTEANVQPEIVPVINDKPHPIEDLEELVEKEELSLEEAKKIGEKYTSLQKDLFALARRGMKLNQEYHKAITEFERNQARILVETTLSDIEAQYPFEEVKNHLKEVREHVLENLAHFKNGMEPTMTDESDSFDDPLHIYTVNVVLDNSDTEGCPVIIETTPTFVNLFGTIERRRTQESAWISDFSSIKAGSLLSADGGYLIINAQDALSEPGVWKMLKRVLLSRKLEIQPIEGFFQTTSVAIAMKPEAIKLQVKVIMIGDSQLYQALYHVEEDFRKIFKVNAQFDYEIGRSDDLYHSYARFIRKLSDEENLLHFDPDGVAAVLEYSAEKAGSNKKLSLRLREASFWAEKEKAELVSRYHVEKAYSMIIDRNSMWKEKIMERIDEGTLLIDTDGTRVGQINGLAVYDLGQVSFGKPTRITATVSVGGSGIVDIEREARLSGSIYNKGSLILGGLFRNRFAQKRPLSLSASIVFEQSYGGVDGDSASSTEVYALMSALSGIPLRQDLAVTGSVNQWGEIQPIGGVKEKIEGFYDVCCKRGLTGKQGVLIPVQNVTDLMLRDDVVNAVEEGKFHVYAVSTIDQGIEILTGIDAGTRNEKGEYEEGTVNERVEQRLIELGDSLRKSMPYMVNGLPKIGTSATPDDGE